MERLSPGPSLPCQRSRGVCRLASVHPSAINIDQANTSICLSHALLCIASVCAFYSRLCATVAQWVYGEWCIFARVAVVIAPAASKPGVFGERWDATSAGAKPMHFNSSSVEKIMLISNDVLVCTVIPKRLKARSSPSRPTLQLQRARPSVVSVPSDTVQAPAGHPSRPSPRPHIVQEAFLAGQDHPLIAARC